MKFDIRDMLDSFSDEEVELESGISAENILKRTMRKIEEDKKMTKKNKITSAALAAAAAAALLSISVFAAYQIFLPKEIAEHFKDYKLAQAFTDEDTLFNIEPQTSGEYTFELLGIVSGKNLSSFTEADADRSYIVASVRRADGEKLYYYPGMMATPLIDGYKPWLVNAFTMNGGRSEFITDDMSADYLIFECDNIEIFADHKIHLAMYQETEKFGMAPSSDLFTVREDGSIEFSENFTAPHAMFTIPIDQSKADPEAAAELLRVNGISEDGFIPEDNEAEDGSINEDIIADDTVVFKAVK